MTEYRVLPEAYVKLMLHAAKHTTNSCIGLLIGSVGTAANGHVVEISDAVPLFHHGTPLAPLTEVACALVDTWSAAQKKTIVGVYHANGVGSDSVSSLSFASEKMVDHIATICTGFACALLVENAQLGSEDKTALQLQLKDAKRGWVRVEQHLHLTQQDSGALLSKALQQRVQDEIVDMDDHFEDVSKDWRNPHVLQLLQLNV